MVTGLFSVGLTQTTHFILHKVTWSIINKYILINAILKLPFLFSNTVWTFGITATLSFLYVFVCSSKLQDQMSKVFYGCNVSSHSTSIWSSHKWTPTSHYKEDQGLVLKLSLNPFPLSGFVLDVATKTQQWGINATLNVMLIITKKVTAAHEETIKGVRRTLLHTINTGITSNDEGVMNEFFCCCWVVVFSA